MNKKIHWHLMNWKEIGEAQKRSPVVLVPAGTLETQGPNTFVGLEYVVPQRLAEEVAQQTNALVLPAIPFGYSALFQDFPGTISLRPEVVTSIYEDIVRSILSHGFDHIMFLAMHVPNQPMMEHVANKIRDEFGVLIAWVNPGRMAPAIMKEVSPNYDAARGHGADPGLSLAKYLEPDMVDLTNVVLNTVEKQFNSFQMDGLTPSLGGTPINMAIRLQDISAESGGFGDPSYATADQGEVIFKRMVAEVCGLVEAFAKADIRV